MIFLLLYLQLRCSLHHLKISLIVKFFQIQIILQNRKNFLNQIIFLLQFHMIQLRLKSVKMKKILRTLSVSLSQSFLTLKSVIFSYKSYVSQVFTNCYLENEQIQSMCLTEMVYYKYEPYIIYYLSPTYIYIPISIQIDFNKKSISSEQLIGIVCGSVSIFFLIVSLIIFIQRKIKSNKYILNSGFSIDESSDQKINESINEYKIDLTNTNNNQHEDDT